MRKNHVLLALLYCSLLLLETNWLRAEELCLESYFQNSLHFSGNGMRYWYEEQNGFMTLTKIPYSQLGCKQCHAKSCDQCHGIKDKAGNMGLSVKESRKTGTCLKCHESGQLIIEHFKQGNEKDVHMAAGMTCISCHKEKDIHGDGVVRKFIQDSGAVNVSCEGCHVGDKATAPRFNPDTRPHKRHKKSTELHCNACHVRSSMNCYNCHFSEFIKTKDRKGNFIPTTDWLMLVNYQDKVTAATAMVLVYNNKTFVSYTPYFTHNIMKKGRSCEECHGNSGMQLIKKGEKIPVAGFENGKITFWKGVIPIAENTLKWQFFDKKEGKWVPLEAEEPTLERFSRYAEPLREKQLKILKVHIK